MTTAARSKRVKCIQPKFRWSADIVRTNPGLSAAELAPLAAQNGFPFTGQEGIL